MRTFVGPHGAQSRLQQFPPHCGRPPSVYVTPPSPVVPPQSMPSIVQPPLDGWPHVPSAWFCALVQTPPQQSLPLAQTSPFCPQYEGAEQMPLLQKFEQHSPPVVHALPSVLHELFSCVHEPFDPHVPLQHCAFVVHVWLSP